MKPAKKRASKGLLFGAAPSRPRAKPAPPEVSFLQRLSKNARPVDRSKLPDEVQALYELMKSAPPLRDTESPPEEPPDPWVLFWATDPTVQEIDGALDQLRKRFDSEPARLFGVLLHNLIAISPAALSKDGETFARVLVALEMAAFNGDLPLLFDRKKADGLRGTIAEVAERYLARQQKDSEILVEIDRPEFVRGLVRWFDPEPQDADVEHRAEEMAVNLLFQIAPTMRKFAGRSHTGTWREARNRIKTECQTVANRLKPRAVDYVAAVLRGWGLRDAEIKSWMRPIRQKHGRR